jgi:hypothetical protein
VQGETEGVSTQQNELQDLLATAAAERLAIIQRHEAGARVVSNYDFNNTYQYVINREETHLSWLQNALAEFGASLPKAASTLAVPSIGKVGKNAEPSIFRSVLEDDAKGLGAFIERWRPKVDAMAHARHRNMMNVILGESAEHQQLFTQAASGFEDLLGKRMPGSLRVGAVLPDRWQE